MLDPIVEEVRKARMEHTMKFNGNLSSICSDLRTVQKNSGHPVVSFVPRSSDNDRDIELVPTMLRVTP